jgi:hypothetical protein
MVPVSVYILPYWWYGLLEEEREMRAGRVPAAVLSAVILAAAAGCGSSSGNAAVPASHPSYTVSPVALLPPASHGYAERGVCVRVQAAFHRYLYSSMGVSQGNALDAALGEDASLAYRDPALASLLERTAADLLGGTGVQISDDAHSLGIACAEQGVLLTGGTGNGIHP